VGPSGRDLRAVPREGQLIDVEGRLQTRQWDDDAGAYFAGEEPVLLNYSFDEPQEPAADQADRTRSTRRARDSRPAAWVALDRTLTSQADSAARFMP
jgi:single-stranded DNA-binding protein